MLYCPEQHYDCRFYNIWHTNLQVSVCKKVQNGWGVMKKKVGIGTLSLFLVIIAFVWSYSIFGFCLGDKVLSLLKLPVWSNGIAADTSSISIVPFAMGGQSIHYTVFYSLILLIPAILLAVKNKNHLFADAGKWMAIIFIALLLVSPILSLI